MLVTGCQSSQYSFAAIVDVSVPLICVFIFMACPPPPLHSVFPVSYQPPPPLSSFVCRDSEDGVRSGIFNIWLSRSALSVRGRPGQLTKQPLTLRYKPRGRFSLPASCKHTLRRCSLTCNNTVGHMKEHFSVCNIPKKAKRIIFRVCCFENLSVVHEKSNFFWFCCLSVSEPRTKGTFC